MTTGYVQVAPDSTGKQLDNDVVAIPAGTILTDGSGNQTTLAAPAYYFRERVINADPNNPSGVARVQNADGPSTSDFGLTVRMPAGQADLQIIAALLQGMSNQLQALTGIPPVGLAPQGNLVYTTAQVPGPGLVSPDVPRKAAADQFGRIVTVPYTTRDAQSANSITITSSTTAQLLWPAISGFYSDIAAIVISNTSATATEVDFSDGTQTIPFYAPAGDMRGLSMAGMLLRQSAFNTTWTVTTLTSVASVKVWAQFVLQRAT